MKRSVLAGLVALALVAQETDATAQTVADPYARLAPHQLEAARDDARRLVITGGRRSGKTEFCIVKLAAVAIAGGECAYISLTRKLAKRTIWKRLKAHVRGLKVDFKINESTLTIDFPGGGMIELGGADDREAIERYRGPAYALVVIDECGAQNPGLLHTLVSDVLRPALMDHQGQLILGGTPGPTLEGYWYDASNEQTRSRHPIYRWTLHDNPIFANRAEAELEAVLEENGWARDNVTFRREYLGHWVQDDSVLVYPFDVVKNSLGHLPSNTAAGYAVPSAEWRHVIAVDIGTTEKAMAIVVWASNRALEDDYLVHAEAHTGMLSGALADRLRQLREVYPGARVVIDAGGMGKAHALELHQRFAIPFEAAEKREKQSAIRIMRDRILAGRVKILALPTLDGVREEWSVLGWDDKHEQHNPNQSDHYSDACLYGLRAMRNWRHDEDWGKPEPDPYSVDAFRQQLENEADVEARWRGKRRKRRRTG